MNRSRTINIVALAAGILWVLALAEKARTEFARGEALLSSLDNRMQAQARENQRLSDMLKRANAISEETKSKELEKLRNEMASLRELTNRFGIKLAAARQEQPARMVFKRSEGFLGGVAVISDSGSPQYDEQLCKTAMDRKLHPEIGDAWNLKYAVRAFAEKNGGVLPDSLQAVAPYVYHGDLPLAGTEKGRDPMAGVADFDLLFQGSMNDLADVPTQEVALLRQQQAWPTPSGKSARIYVMANGKVEVVESDDNFQAWEAAHVVPAPAAGQ